MEQLLNFIAFGIAINFWTHWFTPLQYYRAKLTTWLTNMIVRKGWFRLFPVVTAINCPQCLGFWLGSLVFWSVPIGMIMSVYSCILYKILRNEPRTYNQGTSPMDTE